MRNKRRLEGIGTEVYVQRDVMCGRERVSSLRRAVCQKETQNNTIEHMEWESVGGGRWKSEGRSLACGGIVVMSWTIVLQLDPFDSLTRLISARSLAERVLRKIYTPRESHSNVTPRRPLSPQGQ